MTWEPEKVLRYVDYITVSWRLERFTDVIFYIETISQRSSTYISKNKVAERKFEMASKLVSGKVYQMKRGVARPKGKA